MIDYLKPRLFMPLGIDGMDWEVDPWDQYGRLGAEA